MMINLSKIEHYLQRLRIAANELRIAAIESWPWRRQYKLVIVDDIFPQPFSGFRMAEYKYYLEHIENSVVYSTGFALKNVNEQRPLLQVISDFETKSPEFAGRVLPFSMNRAPGAQLAYVMFLHNAEYFLAWFEKKQIPFIIMLYPGGAFRLDDSDSDAKLRAVFSSTLFRKVIVSQKITQDYLVQKGFCSLKDIKLIYGVITPTEQIKASRLPRKLYKKDKYTFDVCFVAMKYTIEGIDKGYDLFIALAKNLSIMFDDIRFHVVGTFSSEDIDVSEISDKIFFYGPRPRGFFVEFYAGMDAILSANRPFILDSGAFDGFPTTACVEAGLSGVAVFCSDALKQNMVFRPDVDLVLVENDISSIVKAFVYYYNNYNNLIQVALSGQQVFESTYSIESQLIPRIDLIKKMLK